MPLLSFDDLMTAITRDQAKSRLAANLLTLGIDTSTWQKAGVYDSILTSVAQMYSDATVLMVDAIGAAFLEKASGGWLKLLAFYVFGITPPAATFATGVVTLTNTGGGVYNKNPYEIIVRNTVTKKTYWNTAAVSLLGGATLTGVPVSAKEIGTASNANPGDISEFETPLLGVTVTNPEAVVGSDGIADDDLKQMCSDKLGTLSNGGPRSAYAFAARAATRPDGSFVNVNRVAVTTASGVVTVTVAAPSGAPSSADVGYVDASVEALARPDGITAVVQGATEVAVSRTFTVWAKSQIGVTASQLQTLVLSALVDAISTYPLGGLTKPPATQGYLFGDYLDAVAQSAHPSIYSVDGVGADVALNIGQVATLAATVNVRIVAAS